MNDILEKVMNFINENTMLLILICIFLIIILVIYLIDNTIKTKRLEKEELKKKDTEPVVLNNEIPDRVEKEPIIQPAPVVEEPKVEEVPVSEPEITVSEPEIPVIETEEPVTREVPETPVVDTSIEDLLNKDYSMNNEIVNNIPNVQVEEPTIVTPPTPVVEEPKSKYNNDKKLSDIFGKKETPVNKKLESTQDFSDELDKILQKLNSGDSTIDETSDYTNMF